MSGFASAVAGGLAAVLFFSGGTKLLDPAPAAAAMARFGVVRRARAAHARALGVGEVLLGAALLVPQRGFSVLALAAAAALFALFAALQAKALRRGERFACGCFGDDDEPISSRSVARTAALCAAAVAAAAVAWRGEGPSFAPAYAAALGGLSVLLASRCLATIRRHALFGRANRPLVAEEGAAA